MHMFLGLLTRNHPSLNLYVPNDSEENRSTWLHVQIIVTLNDKIPLCIMDCLKSQLFPALV